MDRWNAVATLSDPSRRALYDYVRRQGHAVGRDEAAAATAMSRGLAAFHLDKLVDAGLLAARYEAPADQPRGRGRAPKVYLPAGDGLAVTLPERRYELIAEILAGAVADGGHPASEVAARLAYERGRSVVAVDAGILDVLTDLGFEPHADADGIRLHNCPFHALAARHTDLVCGLNHAFLSGLVAGMDPSGPEPVLEPAPGRCCVALRHRGGAAPRADGGDASRPGATPGDARTGHTGAPRAARPDS